MKIFWIASDQLDEFIVSFDAHTISNEISSEVSNEISMEISGKSSELVLNKQVIYMATFDARRFG